MSNAIELQSIQPGSLSFESSATSQAAHRPPPSADSDDEPVAFSKCGASGKALGEPVVVLRNVEKAYGLQVPLMPFPIHRSATSRDACSCTDNMIVHITQALSLHPYDRCWQGREDHVVALTDITLAPESEVVRGSSPDPDLPPACFASSKVIRSRPGCGSRQ